MVLPNFFFTSGSDLRPVGRQGWKTRFEVAWGDPEMVAKGTPGQRNGLSKNGGRQGSSQAWTLKARSAVL